MGRIYNWEVDPSTNQVTSYALPVAVSGNNISAIADGSYSGLFNGAIDSNNNLYLWGHQNPQTPFLLELPPKLLNTNFCSSSIGTNNTGLTVTAIDIEGNLYSWTYDPGVQNPQILNLPQRMLAKKFCSVMAGHNLNFAIDINNNLYTWYYDINNNPILVEQPAALLTKKVAYISIGYSVNSAIDTDNNLYTWGFNSFPTNPILLTLPQEVINKKICKASTGNINAAALDTDNNLYAWITAPNQNPKMLDQPSQLSNKKFCNIYSLLNNNPMYAAIDTSHNLYTWGYDNNQNPQILAQPASLKGKKIYSAVGTTTTAPIFTALAFDSFTVACPNNISLSSAQPVPVNYDFPSISDPVLQVETTLLDGTVINPGYIFPLGITTVICRTIPKNCGASSCFKSCNLCPCCSFTVTITPSVIPPIPTTPSSATVNIPNTAIKTTKLYDWVVTNDVHRITINLTSDSKTTEQAEI
ncbi:MAG: hypothetical protein RLZ12_449 [Bacillota bacterium]